MTVTATLTVAEVSSLFRQSRLLSITCLDYRSLHSITSGLLRVLLCDQLLDPLRIVLWLAPQQRKPGGGIASSYILPCL